MRHAMSSFLPYSDSFSTKVDGFTRHVNASSRRRLLQKEIQNIHGMSVISAVLQTKVSVFTIPRRSVVEVTYLPAIHRAGQLGLQISVSGQPRIVDGFALVTFTWPGPLSLQVPQRHFFEIPLSRWKEFQSTWPADLA